MRCSEPGKQAPLWLIVPRKLLPFFKGRVQCWKALLTSVLFTAKKKSATGVAEFGGAYRDREEVTLISYASPTRQTIRIAEETRSRNLLRLWTRSSGRIRRRVVDDLDGHDVLLPQVCKA